MARTSEHSLSLCMIVRNEESFLADCLDSVKEVVDEMIVVDTGSTDGTVAIAERFGAQVVAFPWIGDFAAARNVSLSHATGDWILVMDADERLEPGQGEAIRKLLQDEAVAGYSLRIRHLLGVREEGKATVSPMFKLFRNRPEIRYEGAVHEQLASSAERTGLKSILANVMITHLGYLDEFGRTEDKIRRNLEIIDRQLEKDPDSPFGHFNKGECFKFLGQPSEAEHHYSIALQLLKKAKSDLRSPFCANLYYSFAELCYLQRAFSKGLQLLDEGIKLYPDYANLFYTKGLIQIEEGLLKGAIGSFETCLALKGVVVPYPSDPSVTGEKSLRAIASCYVKLGDKRQAREYLKRTLEAAARPDSELYYNLGVLAFEFQVYPEALNYLVLALEADPKNAAAWHQLGTLNARTRRYQDALDAWSQLLSLDPEWPDLRLQMAEAHLQLGQLEAAQRALEEELRLHPGSQVGWVLLGVVQLLSDRPAAAQEAWEGQPMDPKAQALCKVVRVLRGEASVSPSDPENFRRMAITLVDFALTAHHLGLVQQVLDRLDVFEGLAPGFLLNLGQMLVGRELYELAMDCLLLAQQQASLNPSVYLALGDACVGSGNLQDARIMYEEVRKLDPSDVRAKARLKQIESR